MDRKQVQHWKAGFEMAAALDREEKRRRGPDPAQAIAVSRSMIRAARGFTRKNLLRDRSDARVRERWGILRKRLGRTLP